MLRCMCRKVVGLGEMVNSVIKSAADSNKPYTTQHMINYCTNKSCICRRRSFLKIFMAVVSVVLGVNVVMCVGSHVNVDNVIIT